MAQAEGSSDGIINEIVKSLSGERAYLLVFALLFLVDVGSFFSGAPSWAPITITIGSFVLAGYAIKQVEGGKRLTVMAESRDQHEHLEGLRDEDKAIRGVLGSIVSDESDTYFVYSSTPVTGYSNYEGKPIDYPFGPDELLVTAVEDALGIAKVHSLLHLAGKRKRLSIETAKSLPPGAWEKDLILIGSRNSNPKTEFALTSYNAPYRFSEDVSTIVEAAPGGAAWPAGRGEARAAELKKIDYGLLVKLRVRRSASDESTFLILAGIGAPGTLAVCHYLERNVAKLHERFADSAFGCVLSVDREQGYSSVELVTETAIPVFTPRR